VGGDGSDVPAKIRTESVLLKFGLSDPVGVWVRPAKFRETLEVTPDSRVSVSDQPGAGAALAPTGCAVPHKWQAFGNSA
jgi:hypothetical protein